MGEQLPEYLNLSHLNFKAIIPLPVYERRMNCCVGVYFTITKWVESHWGLLIKLIALTMVD